MFNWFSIDVQLIHLFWWKIVVKTHLLFVLTNEFAIGHYGWHRSWFWFIAGPIAKFNWCSSDVQTVELTLSWCSWNNPIWSNLVGKIRDTYDSQKYARKRSLIWRGHREWHGICLVCFHWVYIDDQIFNDDQWNLKMIRVELEPKMCCVVAFHGILQNCFQSFNFYNVDSIIIW